MKEFYNLKAVITHGVLLDQVIRLEDEAEVSAADLGELVIG